MLVYFLTLHVEFKVMIHPTSIAINSTKYSYSYGELTMVRHKSHHYVIGQGQLDYLIWAYIWPDKIVK